MYKETASSIISLISNPIAHIRRTLWGGFSLSRILWRFINNSSLSCQWILNQFIPKERQGAPHLLSVTLVPILCDCEDCVDPKTQSQRDDSFSCCTVSVRASYMHLWTWCHHFVCICDLTWYEDLHCVVKSCYPQQCTYIISHPTFTENIII